MNPKILLLTGETTKYTQYLLSQLLTSCSSKISLSEISMSSWTPQEANITVTFGQDVLSLFSDESLSDVRGTVLQGKDGRKIIPTVSLADLVIDMSLDIIIRADMLKACREKDFSEVRLPNWDIKSQPTYIECMTYLDNIIKNPLDFVAFDLETDMKNQQILCLGLAHSDTEGISIPFSNNGVSHWTVDMEVALWEKIGEFFASPVKKVAHNACFDVASLWQNNKIYVENLWFDTMLAWHVLYLPSGGDDSKKKNIPSIKKDLGFISSLLLDIPAWKHKAKENLAIYNVKDCCATWALVKPLDQDLKSKGLTEIFNFEMLQIESSVFMSLRGICIDNNKREEIAKSIAQEVSAIETELGSILKSDYGVTSINFGSPKQLKTLLYVTMALPIQVKRGTDTITTDEEALDKLYRKTKNKVVELVLKNRKLSKLLSFCDINPSLEGRINTTFNIAGTSSGRWSTSKSIITPKSTICLQTIPKRGEGSIIRSMYVPTNSSNWIIEGDYVQAEAVIIAFLIGDENLKEAFRQKKDIHKLTGFIMEGIPVDEITSEQREIYKLVRHATNYSLGANGLAAELKCEVSIAKRYLASFHASCPQLKRWQEQIQYQLKSNRTLITPLGRKKVFLGRFDNSMFRSAYSFIPQSTIGDLLNKSLVKFYELYGDEYSLLLQLHDAMYVDDVPESKIQDCIEKMKSCMTWELIINGEVCIVDVDFKKGKNWKDMEKIK